MKTINIETIVNTDLDTVLRSLDLPLFKKLNPPFPPVKVLRFDGTAKAGITHLSLNFLLFKQEWISENMESGYREDGQSFQFVDEGKKLPFFLSYWRHTHTYQALDSKSGPATRITDHIQFKGRGLMGLFLQPVLKLQCLYRKPVYRSMADGRYLRP